MRGHAEADTGGAVGEMCLAIVFDFSIRGAAHMPRYPCPVVCARHAYARAHVLRVCAWLGWHGGEWVWAFFCGYVGFHACATIFVAVLNLDSRLPRLNPPIPAVTSVIIDVSLCNSHNTIGEL